MKYYQLCNNSLFYPVIQKSKNNDIIWFCKTKELEINNKIEKQSTEADAEEGLPAGTGHFLAEAAPTLFDCKHQEMSLILANVHNFIKYGTSKGAELFKFRLCYFIYELIIFH